MLQSYFYMLFLEDFSLNFDECYSDGHFITLPLFGGGGWGS